MMGINRDNYEAWFLDYAEGNLNEQQIADLMLFLGENPDLKEELLDDFEGVILTAESVTLPEKESLKQEVGLVNANNVDDFLIGELEGTLNAEEQAALHSFIQQHPTFEKERQLYKKTVLHPDLAIAYPSKEGLKRKRAIVLPLFARYAATAAIVIFVLFLFLQQNERVEGPGIAASDSIQVETQNLAVEPESPSKDGQYAIAEAKNDTAEPTVADQATEVAVAASSPETDVIQKNKKRIQPLRTERKDAVKEDIHVAVEPMPKKSGQVEVEAPNTHRMPLHELNSPNNDSMGMAIASTRPVGGTSAKPTQPGMSVWEYAGRQVKENVLDQENVEDGRIRETDVALAFSKGVDKVSKRNVKFKDKSDERRVSYGISVGKFGFSRTKTRKK